MQRPADDVGVSFVTFLYCSRLGRGGSGSASDIRISFHGMPGVRTNQAERRFVAFSWSPWVGTALSADWTRPQRQGLFSRELPAAESPKTESTTRGLAKDPGVFENDHDH